MARESHPARLALQGLLVWTSCVTGCSAVPAAQEVPAVISEPSAASRAELTRVITEAFNGVPVTLADDALTRESTLTIERTVRRDAQGRPLDGRDPGRPEQFRLVKAGADCVLVHENSARRWTLHEATCAAAPS